MWALDVMEEDSIVVEQLGVAVTLGLVPDWVMASYAERRLLTGETSMALCEIAAMNGYHDAAVDEHLSELGTPRHSRDEAERILLRAAVGAWRSGDEVAEDVIQALDRYDADHVATRGSPLRSALAPLVELQRSFCPRCDRTEDQHQLLLVYLVDLEAEVSRPDEPGAA